MAMETMEIYQDVYSTAKKLSENEKADWAIFFREVMGVDGVIRRTFTIPEQLAAFEKSEEYIQIQKMLTQLRAKAAPVNEEEEPTRVITVRLPKCMHDALKDEAYKHHTSINKLCISKLLQLVDGEHIPSETNGKKNGASARNGTIARNGASHEKPEDKEIEQDPAVIG